MDSNRPQRTAIWRSPMGLVLLAASAAGAYFLLTEHFTHVLQAIPYLVLLACPLMHVFMHRGHGRGHSHHSEHRDDKPPAP